MSNPADMSSVSTQVDESAAAGIGWVDGQYMPVNDARISIRENGFSCSDCTYEVVAVWDGAFFRLEDHLDRLFRSCELLMLEPPMDREGIREAMFEMVRRGALQRAYVQIIVTRGVPKAGKQRDPRRLDPAIYGYALPYLWILAPEKLEQGIDLIIAKNVIRIPPNAFDPTIKNFQWGDFTRGQFEAYDRGGSFCWLTDGAGNLTEGAGYNVFALVDGVLHTAEEGVLKGVTRRVALEIAAELGIETSVGLLPVEVAAKAEEIFITSTAGGVMAVASLDGRDVGAGREGSVTRAIRDRYWELHFDSRFIDPVDYAAPTPS